MQKCYIFVNGNLSDTSFLKPVITDEDFIIAADGGLETALSLGYSPNVVIGDFDSAISIPPKIKNLTVTDRTELTVENVEYIKYPKEKDFLDTDLAIEEALLRSLTDITLVNVIGDEIDHMLGVIFLLTKPKYGKVDLKIRTANQIIRFFNKPFEVGGKIGSKVSLIPIFDNTSVASTKGLKYDPSKYQMSIEDNTGISNEFSEETAFVDITSGGFIVISHL